jgi:membrane protease YdiL (CAAX protease family)
VESAREQARLANRSSARVFLLGLIGTMGGLLGLGICMLLGARFLAAARQYRPPLTVVDRILTPRAPWPFTPSQRTILYYLFLSYLASMALLRMAVSWLGLGLLISRAAQTGTVQAILLSTAAAMLPVALPLFLYVRYGRRAFISPQALGFCTASWKIDIVCGAAGYMAGIPLLYLARTLSENVFRGVETPLNPAISAFAGSDNPIFQLLIFMQAALLAPLIEETLFRGVFFQSLEARMGKWASAILASAVFAILHPQLPLGFLGIFVLGLVFNGLFVLRRSLLPAIIAHAINNGLILIFLLTLIRG